MSLEFTDQANATPVALSEADGWLIAPEDGWHIDGRSFRAIFPTILQPAQVLIQEPSSTMQDNVVPFAEKEEKVISGKELHLTWLLTTYYLVVIWFLAGSSLVITKF